MDNIQKLITDLKKNSINETDFRDEILHQISEGTIPQDTIIAELNNLNNKKIITNIVHQQILALIDSSNAETIMATPHMEANDDSDKTQMADDATIIASSPTEITNDVDITRLSDDKTVVESKYIQSDKTQIKSPIENEKTRVQIDPNATKIAQPDLDITTLANTDSQTANTDISTDADTVMANQQTVREQTQQVSAGIQSSAPKKLASGAIIKDRFILKNVIGAGGMSVVFRALDLRKQEAKNLNPYVAIKVLGDTFKQHPLSLLALERETQKIQSLAHPNIITVYDFDRDGDNIYMTMECLEGQSLDEVIRDHKSGMPFNEASAIIDGMSQALIYAHSKDIIHSDFKPENVYYTKNKITKVLDFGIARAKNLPGQKPVDTVFDAGSLSALTPPYASLEMIQEKDPDPRDDIYALACVTYKLLTGKHPYNNLQADIAQKAEMKPAKINSLDRRQWQTLLSGLAFERNDRISTVEEFLDGIKPKKRGWLYALAAAIVLAIGASGYLGIITEQKAAPKIILTQEQESKIQSYLEIAELYFSLGYLATPPGDSALDQYEKVLAIDPINKLAIEGKKKLVEKYQELASEKLKVKDYAESLQLLETALLIAPDNEDLLDSQNKVKDLRAKVN